MHMIRSYNYWINLNEYSRLLCILVVLLTCSYSQNLISVKTAITPWPIYYSKSNCGCMFNGTGAIWWLYEYYSSLLTCFQSRLHWLVSPAFPLSRDAWQEKRDLFQDKAFFQVRTPPSMSHHMTTANCINNNRERNMKIKNIGPENMSLDQ